MMGPEQQRIGNDDWFNSGDAAQGMCRFGTGIACGASGFSLM